MFQPAALVFFFNDLQDLVNNNTDLVEIVCRQSFSFVSLPQRFKIFPAGNGIPGLYLLGTDPGQNMFFHDGTVGGKGRLLPTAFPFLQPKACRFSHCVTGRQAAAIVLFRQLFSLLQNKLFLHFPVSPAIHGTVSFPSVRRVFPVVSPFPAAILPFVDIFPFSCHRLLHIFDEIFDGS